MERILFIVDAQNDFMPGGALGVPEGDEIIDFITELLADKEYKCIFYSKDWHPENHSSFKSNGGLWPAHCVQGTKGAEIHPDIVVPLERADHTFLTLKGTHALTEQYSAFDDTQIYPDLPIDIVGLATDYCVKATALDFKKAGFEVRVLLEGCRAVNIGIDDEALAIKEMQEAGILVEV